MFEQSLRWTKRQILQPIIRVPTKSQHIVAGFCVPLYPQQCPCCALFLIHFEAAAKSSLGTHPLSSSHKAILLIFPPLDTQIFLFSLAGLGNHSVKMASTRVGQTIAVVDRSGKVISTSKTLMSIFKDAKAAYSERKAEIVAVRRADAKVLEAQRGLQDMSLADDRSPTPIRRSKTQKTSKSKQSKQPPSPTREAHSPASSTHRRSRDLGSVSPSPRIARRHTGEPSIQHPDLMDHPGITRAATTPLTDSFEDPDLAYGEIPPPLPLTISVPQTQESELKKQLGKLSFILDEANCLQHSATKTIMTLQKDPEALAAVGLALAEISQMVAKMAPGALTTIKASFPAIFALLASPQFLIAAGVGVGITVVAFGGYKIVKKIQAKQAENKALELEEIDEDVSRIEVWRRGIEFENLSPGTSVEGEFITPQAMAMRAQAGTPVKRKVKASKSKKDSKSGKGPRSTKSTKSTKEKKVPKPSPLRLLFK